MGEVSGNMLARSRLGDSGISDGGNRSGMGCRGAMHRSVEARARLCWLSRYWTMKEGLAFSGAIVWAEASAGLGGRFGAWAIGRVWGGAAGGTHTDRDPGSDRRMIQRVRALHHGTALGRIIQTERGGRARHLECITEGTHMEGGIYISRKNTRQGRQRRYTLKQYEMNLNKNKRTLRTKDRITSSSSGRASYE